MNFAFYTLGCKVNQYESQAMEKILADWGHNVMPFSQGCDAYVINTCSVTAVADKKNRAVIRRCRKENPQAVIGVCGCYPQHDGDALKNLGVDVIGGSNGREQFLQDMLAFAEDRQQRNSVDQALKRRQFEILPPGGLTGRTRAMLKVQDGCVNFCSYCIIPYTRGPIRSAPISLAVEQAQALAQAGYQEIVVTGIEIASWGVDLPGKPEPVELIAAVCRAVPEQRIRLGSLEPRVITENFCRRLQEFSNLCPQFHLSLQSGCDTVLERMKRKYTTQRYLESVLLLRKYFPGCAITTDLIVAFPGETEEEFRETLAFIEQCRFADMHIFPYSRRPGTPADKMDGQHSNAVKEQRSREAIAVAEKMNRNYRTAMVGSVQQVLFEEESGGFWVGHTPNYVKVYAAGEALHNETCNVQITGLYEEGLQGNIV